MKINKQFIQNLLEENTNGSSGSSFLKKLDNAIDKTSQDVNGLLMKLPIEKTTSIDDERTLIREFGTPSSYVASNKNMYKTLGAIGGASLGAKLAMLPDYDHLTDYPLLLAPLAIGAGFLGGGYLGAKLGNAYGQTLSYKTLNTIKQEELNRLQQQDVPQIPQTQPQQMQQGYSYAR